MALGDGARRAFGGSVAAPALGARLKAARKVRGLRWAILRLRRRRERLDVRRTLNSRCACKACRFGSRSACVCDGARRCAAFERGAPPERLYRRSISKFENSAEQRKTGR